MALFRISLIIFGTVLIIQSMSPALSIAENKVVVIPLSSTKSSPPNFTVLDVTCHDDINFGTTYTLLTNIGSFSKTNDNSTVELIYNGRISAGSMDGAGAVFELRIDNVASTNGRARARLRSSEAGINGVPVSIAGIFTGQSAGTQTVSMWMRGSGGSGTSAQLDPGCWSTDHVVVKEY